MKKTDKTLGDNLPNGFKLIWHKDHVEIRQSWRKCWHKRHLRANLAGSIIFSIYGYLFLDKVLPLRILESTTDTVLSFVGLGVALSVVPFFLYITLASRLNQTSVAIGEHEISVRSSPLALPSKRIVRRSTFSRFEIQDQPSRDIRAKHKYSRIVAISGSSNTTVLFNYIQKLEQAESLLQLLNKYQQIFTDKPDKGSRDAK